MFARSILIGTVPVPTARRGDWDRPGPPRSPITGPHRSLRCARRHSVRRLEHLQPTPPPPLAFISSAKRRQTEGKHRFLIGLPPPPPPPRPRPPLTLSAVFDADAQTEESTFARQNVQPSLCRSPVTGCGSESHTSIKKKKKKDSHFYSFAENSGGVVRLGKEDLKKSSFFFLLLFSENFSVCDLGQRRRWVPSFKYPPLTGRRPGNDQSPFFSTFFLAYIRVR